MNKVHNINLGGQAFTIDDDAYDHLQTYLNSLAKHLGSKSIETDEIISDIEYRIGELFHQNLGARTIITIKDVNDAISIMGTVEDFKSSESDSIPLDNDEEEIPFTKSSGSTRFKPGKQLFRDPDNKVIGGVCSGLANYLGISDPLWVRLAWAIAFFMGGLGFMVYIVAMLIIPEAKTSLDKRSMKGEPIDISDIVNSVEDEIQEWSGRISDWADEHRFRRKQRRRKRRQRRGW